MIRWFPRAFLVVSTLLMGMWANVVRGLDETHVHVVCPEHGELIEQVDPTGPKREEIGADQAVTHHQGCAIAAWNFLATVGLAPPPPAEIPEPAVTTLQLAALRQAEGVAVTPLRNAPKTSPPGV